MEELINFIIELAHNLKYGQWVNKKRSFEKQLEQSLLIEGEQALILKKVANDQLSALIVKGNGIPAFAYFEARKKGWYKIYILNSDKGFYCRLKDIFIEDNTHKGNFYVNIK